MPDSGEEAEPHKEARNAAPTGANIQISDSVAYQVAAPVTRTLSGPILLLLRLLQFCLYFLGEDFLGWPDQGCATRMLQ